MIETSIIIPIGKNCRYLDKCLESLLKQTYQNFEIILIYDGSKPVNYQNKKIKEFKIKHSGPGIARNFGVSKASGKILVFVDSDMEFDKCFLEDLLRPIKSGKTRGVFSKQELVANWDNKWARFWSFNSGFYDKRRIRQNQVEKSPVFRAILKKEFEKVNGFDPIGYDDDWTLSQKLGYQADVSRNAVYYHYNPDSLKSVFFQARWVAKRRYKLGIIGEIIKLIFYCPPISLLVGLAKSIILRQPMFLVFKLVFDYGTFFGLIEKISAKKLY